MLARAEDRCSEFGMCGAGWSAPKFAHLRSTKSRARCIEQIWGRRHWPPNGGSGDALKVDTIHCPSLESLGLKVPRLDARGRPEKKEQ